MNPRTDEAPRSSSPRSAFVAALNGEPCQVLGAPGAPLELQTSAWRGSASVADRVVLGHCVGATVDLGCGPGRMTEQLAARGVRALGVDVVPEAVAMTRERGASALVRDVLGRLPGEGRWDTALLADGNVGIGGDPVELLRRVRGLLSPTGRVVVDLSPPGVGLRSMSLTLVCAGVRSAPFAWALLGVDAVALVAHQVGMRVHGLHAYDGRWFAVLRKRAA